MDRLVRHPASDRTAKAPENDQTAESLEVGSPLPSRTVSPKLCDTVKRFDVIAARRRPSFDLFVLSFASPRALEIHSGVGLGVSVCYCALRG